MDIQPKCGMRFKHSSWQYTNGDPQVCEITRIALGEVYYRDVVRFEHDGQWLDSHLGSCWHFPAGEFQKYCKEIVEESE